MVQNTFWGIIGVVCIAWLASKFGIMPQPFSDWIMFYDRFIVWFFYLTVIFATLASLVKSLVKLRRLNFYERIAVDRGGKLVIKRATLFGYAFIWKIFNYERELRMVNVGTEYSIDLYKGKEIWIDLNEGGKVTLVSPKIWIKIEEKDSQKAVETAIEEGELNFEELIGNVAATTISGYIRSLNVEEVMGVASKNQSKDDNVLWEVIKEKSFFKNLKEKQGVNFCGFTFKDLDFSDEITQKRREEYNSIIGIRIAKNRAESEADEMLGSLIHLIANVRGITVEEVKKAVDESAELQERFLNLYTDFKQRSLTDLTDIRVSGNNGGEVSDIKKGILEVAALFSGKTEKIQQTSKILKQNKDEGERKTMPKKNTRKNRGNEGSLGENGEFSEK